MPPRAKVPRAGARNILLDNPPRGCSAPVGAAGGCGHPPLRTAIGGHSVGGDAHIAPQGWRTGFRRGGALPRPFSQSLRKRSALTPQLRFAAQPSVRTGPPRRGRQGDAPAGAAGRSVEVRRVTGEVQNGRGQNAPSCTAVFALSALFGEKRVHITTVEKGVETVQNPLRKGLGAVA